MNKLKNIAFLILIIISVSTLVLLAAHTPINWEYFGAISIVLAVLIWLQKKEVKKIITEETYKEFSFSHFEQQIKVLLEMVNNVKENNSLSKVSVDSISLPNIDDYRIGMINQLGVVNYTNISIPFAKAERLINRGVSALIDGYQQEAITDIVDSQMFIMLTLDEINKIKVNQNER